LTSPSPEELQDAVQELHQYLSDQKAPLMVADSVELLLRYPPEFFAAQIHSWVASQKLTAPVSDFLYHGAKKVAVMGDLDLLPKDALAALLKGMVTTLVGYCPEPDREILKQNLERLGQAAPQAAAAAVVLHTQAGPAAAAVDRPSVVGTLVARGMHRLSLLLDHLRPMAASGAQVETRREVASQFVTTAAMHAQTPQELDQNLAPLRQVGVEIETDKLLKTLAGSLAGWALPTVEGHAAPVVSKDQLEAVRRIVSLPEDPAEVARRFREMVHAAVDQFNAGEIGRAVALFDLAEQLAAEKKVQPKFVEALRASGHEYLDMARLHSAAARADYRAQLKRILGFFTPTQPAALLLQLDGEPRRDRRHQILALLEVHGEPARAEAWELLKASVQEGAQTDPFFQMNLVYLLRVIRRPDEASVEEEVDVVMRTSARDNPPPLVKQVIAFLGGTRHDKAERALITYLKVFESMMLAPDGAAYPAADVEMLLDRTCAALARYGTPRAWRVLVDHGLKAEARLGSPALRLAEAGRVNLSADRELVARLIATIRAELPKSGMAGLMSRGKGDEKAIALIQALASTPLPGVYELLQEVAHKHGDRELGKAAAATLDALATVGRPPAPPSTLSGDLEMFGLPNLIQTLVQSQLTGVLTVLDGEGRPQAALLVEQGRFRGAHCGPVRGEAAVYTLLERPFKGTFAFVSRDLAGQEGLVEPKDLFGLLMEGVRRYDELQRASAVAPDGAAFSSTGQKPSRVEGEDPKLVVRAWDMLAGGKPVAQCETELATDPYRLRRLAAQWIEDGSLAVRPA
jgi:uncharacterized protein DUF4388